MAKTSRFAGRSGSEARKTMAGTKACGPALGDQRDVGLGVDVDELGQPGRRRLLAVGGEVGLVEPDPDDGALLDDRVAVLAEQLAAVGVEPVLGEPVGPVETGLHQRRGPGRSPGAVLAGRARPWCRTSRAAARPGTPSGRRASRRAAPTVTAVTSTWGVTGPMPRTSGWNRASVWAPLAPANATAVRSFFSSASASWVAAWRAPSVSGGGDGVSPPLQPAVTSASTSSPRPRAPPYPATRRWPDEDLRAAARPAGGPAGRRRRRAASGPWCGPSSGSPWTQRWRPWPARPARPRGRRATSRASSATRRRRPAQVPGLGEQLRRPFDAACGQPGRPRRDGGPAGGEHRAARDGDGVAGVPDPGGDRAARLAAPAGPVRPPGPGGAALHRRAGRPRPVRPARHGQPADARPRRDQRRPGAGLAVGRPAGDRRAGRGRAAPGRAVAARPG